MRYTGNRGAPIHGGLGDLPHRDNGESPNKLAPNYALAIIGAVLWVIILIPFTL